MGAILASSVVAALEVPPLRYHERTLGNGLRVLSVEEHVSPTVAIQVWYHVGSKDDPEGRSGFAHLFEHMMFKSTKNMPAEMFDRLTEDVGGTNNAYTADDVTVYHEVVPSHYLEPLLWAEAERLASLTLDEANFASEREVVKEEFRQNYVARPYGGLFLQLPKLSFAVHPYRRPGIGNLEELTSATLPDVRKFHDTFYRPDTATLAVVGDFDPAQLDTWVDRYFGPLPRPGTAVPRVTVREPPRTAARLYVERGTNVPLPAVVANYLVPPAASGDMFALRLAEAILAEGTSSRLYRSLVYERQVAQAAEAWIEGNEHPALLAFFVIVAGGKTPEQARSALLSEIDRLRETPPAAAELEKAKAKLVTALLRERETNEGKAGALGEAAVLLGDPSRVNLDIGRLARTSAKEVQRAARKYLTQANAVLVDYLPAETPAAAAPGEATPAPAVAGEGDR